MPRIRPEQKKYRTKKQKYTQFFKSLIVFFTFYIIIFVFEILNFYPLLTHFSHLVGNYISSRKMSFKINEKKIMFDVVSFGMSNPFGPKAHPPPSLSVISAIQK